MMPHGFEATQMELLKVARQKGAKRKKPESREAAIQKAILQLVFMREEGYPDWRRVYHTPNGEKRDGFTGMHLQKMGARPGVWDLGFDGPRVVGLPEGWRFCAGLRIEVKHYRYNPANLTSEKRRALLSEHQQEWLEFYRANHLLTAVVVDQLEGFALLKWYIESAALTAGLPPLVSSLHHLYGLTSPGTGNGIYPPPPEALPPPTVLATLV